MKAFILIIAALAINANVHAGDAPAETKAPANTATSNEAGTTGNSGKPGDKASPAAKAEGGTTGKHLFILSGQSNMHHMSSGPFSSIVKKAFGEGNVTVVKSAKRGAPIRTWDKDYKWPEDLKIPQGRGNKRAGKEAATREEFGKGFGRLYDALMAAVKKRTEGQTYDTVTFVWMQGESDTSQQLNLVDLYFDSFNRIVARLKKDLNIKTINIVIGRLSDYGMGRSNWEKLRELQVKYAEENPNCEWVVCDDLNDIIKGGKTENDLHYTEEGYKILAQRFAEKAVVLIQKTQVAIPKE